MRRLLEDNRLLTLTGSGGCGKTRLALAAAGELVGGFEDGAWLVELASLADPALVQGAVASVLGVREQPGSPPTEALSGHLAKQEVASGPRQLRAPRRSLRRASRGALAGVPEPAYPRHQPGGLGYRRRDPPGRAPAILAGSPPPSGRRGSGELRSGRPVRGPGESRRARVRAYGAKRNGRCADMLPAGRHSSGNRACGGQGEGAIRRADRRTPGRPFRPAHGRRSGRLWPGRGP